MSQVVPAPPASRPSSAADPYPPAPRQAGHPAQEAAPVILAAGASFEGWLTCRKAARIEGCFRGTVVAEGRIELGEDAEVIGRIEARDIVVAGSFEGELVASHCIELLATARVTGELYARELAAEEGCTVSGRCRTGSPPKAPL